ncbi:hypothetical protein PBCVAN69C_664L [Paramecium bursaria Chlorella virus AN69C]|uniref:Uncharacterized protein n=1 Tax=Paramecium bursaria Chlorella virus IL3A TaxID=46019 RepID=M1HQ00_PBCVI|nr:hypothetical protein PBCVAN69C_664L [Paramecium bursaria Chlorella virus AN69C]AGE53947.1 hypothetical protein PBCVIL3A_507R [Paramecium bursaria Chlorella virus IL3A]
MFQPNVFRLCVNTKIVNPECSYLHNLENITLQKQKNGDKNMMWGITTSGSCVYSQFKAGDYIVLGHSGAGGFMYRATIASAEVDKMLTPKGDTPEGETSEWVTPDWDTPTAFVFRFIITDIRKIKTIKCSRFGVTGRQAYTKVEGELAQEIIGL